MASVAKPMYITLKGLGVWFLETTLSFNWHAINKTDVKYTREVVPVRVKIYFETKTLEHGVGELARS